MVDCLVSDWISATLLILLLVLLDPCVIEPQFFSFQSRYSLTKYDYLNYIFLIGGGSNNDHDHKHDDDNDDNNNNIDRDDEDKE